MMRSGLLLLAVAAASSACDARQGETDSAEMRGNGDVAAAERPRTASPADSAAAALTFDSAGPGSAPPLAGGALSPSAAGAGGGTNPGAGGGSQPADESAAPAAPVTSDAAREVLLRAERAYEGVRSLRADFVQDLTVPLLGSSQRSRGQIFHRKPDRFLMRFSDPAGDVVVADGRQVWLYYPSTDPKQVIRTSAGEAGRLDLQREFLSNPTERFEATIGGTESVDGRPATALTLIPRGASPYRRVRIWVDSRDALVRRFEITENNDAVRRVELRNLEANVSLGDDLFTFTPPAGTQVFDQ